DLFGCAHADSEDAVVDHAVGNLRNVLGLRLDTIRKNDHGLVVPASGSPIELAAGQLDAVADSSHTGSIGRVGSDGSDGIVTTAASARSAGDSHVHDRMGILVIRIDANAVVIPHQVD